MPTKYIDADKGTTTRVHTSGSPTQGSGESNRLFVGRYGSYNYDSFIRFDFAGEWTDVGRIVSAHLVMYRDNGESTIMPWQADETPRVAIRRLTAAFTEGDAPSGSFHADNYTNPSRTTTGEKTNVVAPAFPDQQFRVDITDFVGHWAPATVQRKSGTPGGKAANHGIALYGYSETNKNVSFWSENASSAPDRPQIELVYELGVTVPTTPADLAPAGNVVSLTDFQGDFADARITDKLQSSTVQVFGPVQVGTAATNDFVSIVAHGYINGDRIAVLSKTGAAGLTTVTEYYVRQKTANTFKLATTNSDTTIVDITSSGTDVAVGKLCYNLTLPAGDAEVTNARFAHIPNDVSWLKTSSPYRWRARVKDNEGQLSEWTALTAFTVTNTAPNAPTLLPADAASFASLDGVPFSLAFTDSDAGDTLLAYEVQMTAYDFSVDPEEWADPTYYLWSTGKRYVAPGGTAASFYYGGAALAADTYYWRARVWDNHDGVSNWAYSSMVLSAAFVVDPGAAPAAIQQRPQAPWRIVVKDMGALRGPGNVVAIIENAKSPGASLMYNSPGECHFTLSVDHPQIDVIEPRQTHYSVQFYTGDGWREKYAGLIVDADATERDVVFYGIDYLGLYDFVMDERYDPNEPDKASAAGGSKYTAKTIQHIITDQLTRAKALPNSPVGFITIGTIAAEMSTEIDIFSTMQPTLQFVAGLIESHRSGNDKRTRVQVRQKQAGGYEVVVQDSPGVVRDNLRLRYGELVQGYRVILFGDEWATRINSVGRSREGVRVMYEKALSGLDEATWGRFAKAVLVNDVLDEDDLRRRTMQMAKAAGKLGKQVGLGLRVGLIGPRDGYDVTDIFPISIEHGAISTAALGSGYWVAVGVTWEGGDEGNQSTVISFRPREDGTAPSTDLIQGSSISPQAEWQIGWTPPADAPTPPTARYWRDETTGTTYVRGVGTIVVAEITGTA